MNRRNFLRSIAGAATTAMLPLGKLMGPGPAIMPIHPGDFVSIKRLIATMKASKVFSKEMGVAVRQIERFYE